MGKYFNFMIIVATVFVILCCEYVFFKKFVDFQSPTVSMPINGIKSVQVIHLKQSVDRRQTYENMINTKFNGKLLGVSTKDLTMDATDGKNDLVFIKLDNNNKEVDRINASDIVDGEKTLEDNIRYKVFDRNHPDFFYYYKYDPSDVFVWKDGKRHMGIGEFGCLTSHLRAINNVANGSSEYGAIFEDDFELVDDFNEKLSHILKEAPAGFGILKLDGVHNRRSGRWNSWLRSRLRYGDNRYFYNATAERRKVGFATVYIVSKDYANRIMKWVQNNDVNGADGTTDIFLFMTLPRRYTFDKIWIAKRWMVGQNFNFTHSGSDIDKIGRTLRK